MDLSSGAPVHVISGEKSTSLSNEMPVLIQRGNVQGLISFPPTVTPIHSLQLEGKVESSSENRPAVDIQKMNIPDIENKKRYPCKYCDRAYSSPASRYNHYNRDHSVEYKLDRCNTSTQAVSSYGPEYPCNFCPNSYWNQSTYINHVKFRHPEGSRNVQPTKEENDANSNVFNMHAVKSTLLRTILNAMPVNPPPILQEVRQDPSYPSAVHSSTNKFSQNPVKITVQTPSSVKNVSRHSVQCEFCLRTFESTQGLGIHVSKIHSDLKDSSAEIYVCSYCPKKYDNYTTLYIHHIAHHDNKPRPYMEQLYASDGKKSTKSTANDPESKTSVVTNSAIVLKKESSHVSNQLKCDQCTKVFINSDYLAKHKLTHVLLSKPGPIFCENCGQVFKGIHYLTQHRRGTKCGLNSPINQIAPTKTEAEITYSNENLPIDVHRKQNYEEISNTKELLASIENDKNHLPSKVLEGPFNTKEESHQSVSPPKPSAIESPLSLVKLEREEPYENSLSTCSTTVSTSVPENSFRTSAPTHDQKLTVTFQLPGTNTAVILNDYLKRNNKEKEPWELKPATVNSVIEYKITEPDTSITTRQSLQQIPIFPVMSPPFLRVERRQPIDSQPPKIVPDLFTPISTINIEKSHLPLSAAVITRAIQHPGELMIIWTNGLEDDLIAAGNINSANCILCVHNLDMLRVTDQQKESLKKSEITTFTMLTSNDNTSLWTVISFGEQNCPIALKNKLFRSFQDVEKVYVDHSRVKGKTINNMMRYTKDGLYPILSNNLTQKTMAFNYEEEK